MANNIRWIETDEGSTIGEGGVDGGIIVKDLEGPDARITLEKNSALGPYSITCALYGNMVHSFSVEGNSPEETFERVKKDLEKIIAIWPKENAPKASYNKFVEAIEKFVTRY